MDSCIFCKILKGNIPCSKVYEDNAVLAFLDLNPASHGHTLIVPRKHAATLLDLEPGTGDAIMQAMRKVGKALQEVTGAAGFNCIQNNFAAAGQEVMHLHWHVIPRFEGDNLIQAWKPGSYEGLDRMAQMAARLNSVISSM